MIEPGSPIEFKPSTQLGARWLRGELVSDDGRRCVVLDGEGEQHTLAARYVRARVEATSTRRAIAPLPQLEEPRTISAPSFVRPAQSPAIERAFAQQVEGRTVEPEPEPAWAEEPPPMAARAPVVRPSIEAFHKAAPIRSALYLAFVREHPCCACQADGPSDPHHYGPRGMGEKADDTLTVPLCRPCHDDFHQRRAVRGRNVQQTEILFWRTEALLLTAWCKRGALFDARRPR